MSLACHSASWKAPAVQGVQSYNKHSTKKKMVGYHCFKAKLLETMKNFHNKVNMHRPFYVNLYRKISKI